MPYCANTEPCYYEGRTEQKKMILLTIKLKDTAELLLLLKHTHTHENSEDS